RLSESKDSLPAISAQRQMEPARLAKLVRGELDWIVMKALEKDRNRRYETANGFAADVQRYLSDEPVLACPPSVSYRLGKLLRRNKRPVLVTSVIVLLLAAAVVGTTAGVVRQWRQDDAIGRKVADDVREARQYQREERWPEAARALERAAGRLATGGPAHLRQVVEQMLLEAATVARLEEAPLVASNVADGLPDYPAADRAYEEAVAAYGMDLEALSTDEAARRLRGSPIAGQLLTALEDWARVKDKLRKIADHERRKERRHPEDRARG